MPKYKRVLLKLSGEVLAGDTRFGLDFDAVRRVCSELVELHASGMELCVVVGGGNMLRGREVQKLGIERAQADYMGMLGTVMNALALQDALEKMGVPTRVQTAITMRDLAEPYIRRRALRHMEKGRIVIFGAGTGHPFFSTDTTAALRAAEMGVDCLVKGTKVDGIYDADPKTHPEAKFLSRVTYMEALQRDIEVMDASAFSLCREAHIPILVLNIQKPGCLVGALVRDENTGTIVEE
ncbi:MAG: UMP kinase [Synergistaceae bacterium]|nr:UMP kinase [Synergistaceae bacterium]